MGFGGSKTPKSVAKISAPEADEAWLRDVSEEEDISRYRIDSVTEDLGNDFWTQSDEMIADIEDLGYTVEEANDEYIAVTKEDDYGETHLYILELRHANSTIWVSSVREEEII